MLPGLEGGGIVDYFIVGVGPAAINAGGGGGAGGEPTRGSLRSADQSASPRGGAHPKRRLRAARAHPERRDYDRDAVAGTISAPKTNARLETYAHNTRETEKARGP